MDDSGRDLRDPTRAAASGSFGWRPLCDLGFERSLSSCDQEQQCGFAKKMALELLKAFAYNRLEQGGHCTTVKDAKEMVARQYPLVCDILEEVINDHPVLLNRAATLHRLVIQAFEPVRVEG